MISKGIPGADPAIQEAIDSWRDGLEPSSPWEAAVFACVDQVVGDMDEAAEAEPDLDDQEEDERHESRGTLADSQDAREFYDKEGDS